MWRPFGPTTSSTSGSMISCNTPSPTPTLSASSPSLAAPASSPSATRTRSGNSSTHCSSASTGRPDTVPITVGPPVLVGHRFAPVTVPTGPDEGGRTAVFKFYELRDNLVYFADPHSPWQRATNE